MFKGVVLSVTASLTFGVLYFFTTFLAPLNSEQTFAWRMLSTLPFLTFFMYWSGDFKYISAIWQRLKAKPQFILMLLVSSILCTSQLWLFLWGPMNGRGLQVSLGYFLLPLVMVLIGCILFKEKLSRFQVVAVALAAIGVGHELWRIGGIAWETAYVAVAYPFYFFLRKKIHTDHLGGFWWDIVLILPVAIYLSSIGLHSYSQFLAYPHLFPAIAGLGALSALGLGSYILASRYLPMVIFGLLSYLEPVLLALASVALGEAISGDEWLTYIPIWCAVLVLVVEGSLHLYRQQKNKQNLVRNLKSYQTRLKDD